jgi:hypothetical protein
MPLKFYNRVDFLKKIHWSTIKSPSEYKKGVNGEQVSPVPGNRSGYYIRVMSR